MVEGSNHPDGNNVILFPARHPDELREAMAQAKSLPEMRALGARYFRAVRAFAGPNAVWIEDAREPPDEAKRRRLVAARPPALPTARPLETKKYKPRKDAKPNGPDEAPPRPRCFAERRGARDRDQGR